MDFALVLIALAVIAVVAVLVLGLANMLKGGDPKLSQKLMRWRVALQFGAIVLIGLLASLGLIGQS